MDEHHLILFSRAPVAGQTKTRLARQIGAEPAREFHAACLRDLIPLCEAVAAAGNRGPAAGRCHIFITPPHSEAEFHAAGVDWPGTWRVHSQQGATLGDRMRHAMQQVLNGERKAARALLLGSDLPLVTADHLRAAFHALDSADAVFGPTPDGGYHLVGLRRPAPALFALKAWGHGRVLEQSLKAAQGAGLRTAVIDALPDLDTLDDLPTVRAHPLYESLHNRHAIQFLERLDALPNK